MKKYLLFIVFILLLDLVACKSNNNKEKTKNEIINELLSKGYNSINLEVKTSKDNFSLTNTYSLAKKDELMTFTYNVQSYNNLSLDDFSTEEKIVKSGRIEYDKNGKRVIEGEDLDIPSNLSLESLIFDEESFDSVEYLDNKVIIKSNNAKTYLKSTSDILDFNMTISYTNSTINSISITYYYDSYFIENSYTIE